MVNPDGYKGHWNMRLRGSELRMAHSCERVDSWVVVTFCPASYVAPSSNPDSNPNPNPNPDLNPDPNPKP